MEGSRDLMRFVGRSTRRVVVTTLGCVLLVVGVAMLLLPGPGLLAMAAGLAVLASEYAWARRALKKASDKAKDSTGRIGRLARRGPAAKG